MCWNLHTPTAKLTQCSQQKMTHLSTGAVIMEPRHNGVFCLAFIDRAERINASTASCMCMCVCVCVCAGRLSLET